ncbi:MAG: hypothetical protein WAU68_08340 [Vitreimonas sp.]
MFETLENNPTLRERVLGMTAIGAILLGGAAGVDTMLTSGWQIGGDGASAAPVVYASASTVYQDDVNRDWSTSPPQRVQLAAQDASMTVDPSEVTRGLEGDGTVTAASFAPSPSQQALPAAAQPGIDEQTSDQRFQAIENDVRQATAAVDPDAAKVDSPSPSANDQG